MPVYQTSWILRVICHAILLLGPLPAASSSRHTFDPGADPCGLESASVARPNIIVILADDFGWGDVGAFWHETADTPNLDKLAESGVRLTDFHAAASVCAPSRASLLTGRLGLRNGVVRNFEPESVGGLPLTEVTLAEMFKEGGYQTGMIGKWHLGTNGPYHPRNRGFDHYYGIPYSNDMGCTDYPGYNLPMCQPCPAVKISQGAYHGHRHGKYDDALRPGTENCDKWNLAVPLYSDFDIIEQPVDLRTLASRYAERTRAFLEGLDKTKPFFLYIALAHMHVPQQHSSSFTNSSSKGTVFADTLREMDDLVGKVMLALSTEGKENNTLVWFTGDNGPWDRKCDLTGSPGPFVGGWQRTGEGGGASMKQTTWEGGHREATVVVWPGHIRPGTSSSALTSTLDILPTLATLASLHVPNDRQYDGIDISDVLCGATHRESLSSASTLTQEIFQWRHGEANAYSMSAHDDRSNGGHTFLFHPNSGVGEHGALQTVRLGQFKARYISGSTPDCAGRTSPVFNLTTPLLFDLVGDPGETTPLNVTLFSTIIGRIQLLLDAVLRNISTDLTSVAIYARDVAAQPCCNAKNPVCRCDVH